MSPKGDYALGVLRELSESELELFTVTGGLTVEEADKMRENVIGVIKVPIGVAEGVIVNNNEHVVPIATEEPGVISQIILGAYLAARGGGFQASTTGDVMIGQIQILDVPDMGEAERRIVQSREALLADANTVSRRRKAVDLRSRRLCTEAGEMLIFEVLVDVKDSMGANLVDTICELLAPGLETLTGGRVNMSILSNLATERLVRVHAVVPRDIIGDETVDRIVKAYAFASVDPYRATTHNKGVMNGVIGVLLATSNDTRAVEAGAHSYAALTGRYRPLSRWWKTTGGDLEGMLEMPLPVSTVGGTVQAHRLSSLVLKILGVETASELAMVAGSVGLACNLGALYTLVSEGIMSIQKR
jgi:hydroxymethylglutaryl-CoA reductase